MGKARSPRVPVSLRTRFLCLFLLVVLSNGAGFGWYFYKRSRESIESQIRQRAVTIAWTLAFNSRYAVLTHDRVVLKDLATRALEEEDVAYVAILDLDGTPLVDTRGSSAEYERDDPLPRGSILDVEVPIAPGGPAGIATADPEVETLFGVGVEESRAPRGRVRVGLSGARMEEDLGMALRSSALLSLGPTAFGLLVTLALVRYLIQPIQEMSKRLALVAAGDLTARLPEDRGDEIGRLARSFNKMAESLQSSREAEKAAQEALLQASRLAAVGEVAGQAAHEILNPLAAVHGRLEIDRQQLAGRCEPLLGVMRQIVGGWSEAYRDGGWIGLAASLRHRVAAPDSGEFRPIVEEDIDNLEKIHEQLRTIQSRHADDIDFLLREVSSIGRIVEGMRGLSRAGGTPEIIDVHDALHESIEVLRKAIEKSGIRLDYQPDGGVVEIHADRGEIVQIFTNLLRNSVQAIDLARGRTEGAISIQVLRKSRSVEVAVADNGAGILPQDQGRLFETRFTTKGPREGTGLGLGICRRLARAARGDVRLVASTPGRGTTMVVELPRVGAS